MSLLPHDTFVNAARPLWAAEGSGGGSTLTSPASITPASNGSASLLVAVTGGVAQTASLTVANTTGNDAVVNLINTAGGNSLIAMGLAASTVGLYAPSSTAGVLGIGASVDGDVANPNLLVDTVNNTVLAGNNFSVSNPAYTPNALTIQPQSATATKISQVCASGGSLTLGSSLANQAGLVVSDVPRSGVINFVQVAGAGGGASLFLSGNQAEVGECVIAPDVAAGGTLALGSSSVVANPESQAIVITDAATTVNRLGGAPQTLMTAANINAGYTNTFTGPVGEGLYAILVCGASPSNAATRDAQMSTMAYVNSTGQIKMGGNATTSTPGGGVLDLFPIDSTTNMFLQYTGTGQGLVNVSIVAFKISGPIPGTF